MLEARGDAAALLSGERTALNFLAHLSGVATMAARAVRAVEGTGARVLDTRKTTPGLRALEKQAVAAGGGVQPPRRPLRRDPDQGEPHRRGRGDRGRRSNARGRRHPSSRAGSRSRCATTDEIEQALAAGAPRLLLDNMDLAGLRAAVAQVAGRAELEASGGVDLETLRAVAETGVEWISMGALTHSAPALDLSLNLEVLP